MQRKRLVNRQLSSETLVFHSFIINEAEILKNTRKITRTYSLGAMPSDDQSFEILLAQYKSKVEPGIDDLVISHQIHSQKILKEGPLLMRMVKYWFILRHDSLQYYKKKEDKEPLGEIDLSEKITFRCQKQEKLSLTIYSPRNIYTLEANSLEELNQWEAILNNLLLNNNSNQNKNPINTTSCRGPLKRGETFGRTASAARLLKKLEVGVIQDGESGVIKAATTEYLFNLIFETKDGQLRKFLLMTYGYWTTAQELAEFLFQKFLKQDKKVLIEITNIFQQWLKIEHHLNLHGKTGSEIQIFIKEHHLNERNQVAEKESSRRSLRIYIRRANKASTSIRNQLLQFKAEELAHQFTLIEHQMFSVIPLNEFWNGCWTKEEKEIAPFLHQYIERANFMTFWVATEIVLCSDLNTRVLCVKKFISIAKHCLILNNFNTAFEICSGLNLACISRLKQTWKNVPKKDFYTFEKLTQLFVPLMNYRTYRDTLASKQGPIVPYLAVTLRDLSLVELHNETVLENSKMINVEKLRIVASIIEPILDLQERDYGNSLIRDDGVQRYLVACKSLKESELWDMSKVVEPNFSQEL